MPIGPELPTSPTRSTAYCGIYYPMCTVTIEFGTTKSSATIRYLDPEVHHSGTITNHAARILGLTWQLHREPQQWAYAVLRYSTRSYSDIDTVHDDG